MAQPVYDYKKIATARDAAVALGIDNPGVSGAAVLITELPETGSIIKPDGTSLEVGEHITGAMLADLRFQPGGEDSPGTGTFGYSIGDAGVLSTGAVDVTTVSSYEHGFFTAYDGIHGREIWTIRADGSVELVADINPGEGSSDPNIFEFEDSRYDAFDTSGWKIEFVESNGALYFSAFDPVHGEEVRRLKADGSVELVGDFNPGVGSSYVAPHLIAGLQDSLYITAYTGRLWEMYRVDSEGVVEKLPVDVGYGLNQQLVEYDNALYFEGTGSTNLGQLHRINSDGSVELAAEFDDIHEILNLEGAVNLLDQWTVENAGLNGSTSVEINGKVYFSHDDPLTGTELYRLADDGTAELVEDINKTTEGSSPYGFFVFEGTPYFSVYDTGWNNGPSLWRLNADGKAEIVDEVTSELEALQWEAQRSPLRDTFGQTNDTLPTWRYVELANDRWEFTQINSNRTVEWAGDGSDSSHLETVPQFLELNNQLFFFVVIHDPVENPVRYYATSLWRVTLDGGAELLNKFDGYIDYTSYGDGVEFGGDYYFGGYSLETGVELWRLNADGSLEIVQDIYTITNDSRPGQFATLRVELPDGSDGDDVFIGSRFDETINGLGGDDVLSGGEGADAIDGGAGTDRLEFAWSSQGVNLNLHLGQGYAGEAEGDTYDNIEEVYGSSFEDVVTGGAADEQLRGRAGDDLLSGGGGEDVLLGGSGNDALYGGAGDDHLYGQAGDDRLTGGDGDDHLRGNDGYDVLAGGEGRDDLRGGLGDDWLFGDSGNDFILGEYGADLIEGGAGDDMVKAGGGDDVVNGGAGYDLLYGQNGDDQLNGGDDNDWLRGDNGNDTLTGGAGNDDLRGGAGEDVIYGGAGHDYLMGGTGADVLGGGSGDDVLRGGLGADVFDFNAGNDIDRVRDWEDGTDRIDLSDFGYANAGAALADFVQQGSNVRFINGADELVIENEVLADISAADLILM